MSPEKVFFTATQGMTECKQCGHKWFSRISTKPKSCPKCKSYHWSEPKQSTQIKEG